MPEDRNRFNNIFGGYTMRLVFELAWANVAVYAHQMPYIKHMDDILFRNPVPALLYMNSQVYVDKGRERESYLYIIVNETLSRSATPLVTKSMCACQ
jgi:acyl-coenzyme A thioesterase 9